MPALSYLNPNILLRKAIGPMGIKRRAEVVTGVLAALMWVLPTFGIPVSLIVRIGFLLSLLVVLLWASWPQKWNGWLTMTPALAIMMVSGLGLVGGALWYFSDPNQRTGGEVIVPSDPQDSKPSASNAAVNQTGGISAGSFTNSGTIYTGPVTIVLPAGPSPQAVIPTPTKPPPNFANELKGFYAEGVALRNKTANPLNKEADIVQLALDTNAWSKKTYDWINKHMGHPAAMKFSHFGDVQAPQCPLDETVSAYAKNLCVNARSALRDLLANLDALITTPDWGSE